MAAIVYCIYSPSARRSYVGYTVAPERRLRQHNRALRGGARATACARDWVYLAHVVGFGSDRSARRAAMRFEWLTKHRSRRHRAGESARVRRLTAMRSLLAEPEWRGLTLRPFPLTLL